MLLRTVYGIEIHENASLWDIDKIEIEIRFADEHTRNVIIDKNGNFKRYIT